MVHVRVILYEQNKRLPNVKNTEDNAKRQFANDYLLFFVHTDTGSLKTIHFDITCITACSSYNVNI